MIGESSSPMARARETGQTMVEFALSASLLFLLLFGLMEMSFPVYDYNTASSAADEAVRYAIVHSPAAPTRPPPRRFSR
jgi:Flp pilus assembly protein TadG